MRRGSRGKRATNGPSARVISDSSAASDLGGVHEFVQAAAVCLELARRLRAAQQQQANDGELGRRELDLREVRVAEALLILLDAAAELLRHHELLGDEIFDRALHDALLERHAPARGSISGCTR